MEPSGSTTTIPIHTDEPSPPAPSPTHIEARDLCPVHESIKIIGRKWHLIILWELSKRPHGFNELKGATKGISAKMLSQSLTDLEDAGLVVREIVSQRPLRVAYHLTHKARELSEVFATLHDWGTRHGLCENGTAALGTPRAL